MGDFNLHEKTLIHLNRFRNVSLLEGCMAPLEITQDGISMALGISRNHASVVLGKMQDNGEIDFTISRIRHSESGIKRKAYYMTNKGMFTYLNIARRMEDEGLSEDDVLIPMNINCFSGEMLDGIETEDMDVIGMVSVIRMQMMKSQIGRRIPKVLPFDSNGRIFLKEDTKKRICRRASAQDLRRWHSLAADWCSENCHDVRERLYHLMESGRNIEAEQLIARNMYFLMDNPSSDLIPGLTMMMESSPDATTPYVTAMIAIRNGMMSESREAISCLRRFDEGLACAMESELELFKGDYGKALDLAMKSYRGDMETGMALGKSMMKAHKFEEALVFLHRSRMDMFDRQCVFRLDEELRMEAEAMGRMGDEEHKRCLETIAGTLGTGLTSEENLRGLDI